MAGKQLQSILQERIYHDDRALIDNRNHHHLVVQHVAVRVPCVHGEWLRPRAGGPLDLRRAHHRDVPLVCGWMQPSGMAGQSHQSQSGLLVNMPIRFKKS